MVNEPPGKAPEIIDCRIMQKLSEIRALLTTGRNNK